MWNCPQCGIKLQTGITDPHRASLDHILPAFTGAKKMIYGDTKNTRVMCQVCNTLTALCLNCVGAAACARDVGTQLKMRPSKVARDWGFGYLQEVMPWPPSGDVGLVA